MEIAALCVAHVPSYDAKYADAGAHHCVQGSTEQRDVHQRPFVSCSLHKILFKKSAKNLKALEE